MSIIDKIYLNDLENKKIPVTNDIFNFNKKVHKLINHLGNELTEKQRKTLSEIGDIFIDLTAEVKKNAYIAGFKSGLGLAMETLFNTEEQ